MKLNFQNLLTFGGIYLLIILVSNFIYALTIVPGFDGFILTVNNLFQSSAAPTMCNIWPLSREITPGARYCTYNLGFVLLNIYFAIVSYLLVFKGKMPIKYWVIAFVFLNILILMFVRLKDYLYAGI